MKKLVAALLALPLVAGVAFAAQQGQGGGGAAALVGNAANGKTYWESPQHACQNCHGPVGQGAFGPDLAGRGLNTVQVLRAVRAQRHLHVGQAHAAHRIAIGVALGGLHDGLGQVLGGL